MDKPIRLIKKYPNRRLYDTEKSRYITIDDVRKLVVEGAAFQVIDAETQEDLTRHTLIQIIIDQESGSGVHLFTTDLLAKFIRMSHNTAQDVFSRYLEQSTRFFLEQQQRAREQMQGVLSGKPVQTLTQIAQNNLKLLLDMQEGFFKAAGFGTPKDAGTKDPK